MAPLIKLAENVQRGVSTAMVVMVVVVPHWEAAKCAVACVARQVIASPKGQRLLCRVAALGKCNSMCHCQCPDRHQALSNDTHNLSARIRLLK